LGKAGAAQKASIKAFGIPWKLASVKICDEVVVKELLDRETDEPVK